MFIDDYRCLSVCPSVCVCVCAWCYNILHYRKFNHENLVKLYGVCSQQGPIFIVTELMKNGKYLYKFTELQTQTHTHTNKHTHTNTHTHTYKHTHKTHTHTHTNTHTYKHTHKHTHTQTHTHNNVILHQVHCYNTWGTDMTSLQRWMWYLTWQYRYVQPCSF